MVDVSRIQAAEVATTSGSAGRTALTSPSGSSFSALSSLAGSLVEGRAASAKAAAQGLEDAASNEYAAREAEVNIASFSADPNAPLLSAFGLKAEPGADEEITKEEMQAFAGYQRAKGKLEAVAPQLRDRARIDIAQESLRVELLRKYPTLKSAVFKANNPEAANRARDLQDEEGKEARTRILEAKKTRDEVGVAQIGMEFFTLSEAGQNKLFNAVQRDGARYKTTMENAAILAADEAQSEVAKKNALRQNAAGISDVVAKNLYTAFNAVLNKGGSPEQIAQQGAILEASAMRELGKMMGGATPAEVKTQFGWLMDTFSETRKKLATKEYTLEQAKIANETIIATATTGILTEVPGAGFAVALPELLGDQGMRLLETTPSLKAVNGTILAAAARNMNIDTSGDLILRNILGEAGVNANISDLQGEARKTGRGVVALWDSKLANSPALARAGAAETLSYVASPAVARDQSLELIRAQLPAMAHPKFREALSGRQAPVAATDNLDNFVVQQSKLLQSKLNQDKGQYSATLTADGKIALKVGTKVSPARRRDAQRLVAELNDSIRSRAHLADTDDYRSYMQEYATVPEFGTVLDTLKLLEKTNDPANNPASP